MARIAHVVAKGYPHHVTQRGNRRQQVFFGDEDHEVYLALLAEYEGVAYSAERGNDGAGT